MTGAYRMHQTRGPEVMHWAQDGLGQPGAGQVRVRHRVIVP